jgi:DNA-binding transcriptional ArsR family regulator
MQREAASTPVAAAPGEPGRVRLDPARATAEEMDRAVGLFKVLSHPDRLRLACALGDGRVTTQTELVEEFGWPQSTAARHVGALRSAGLITAERDGTEVRLRLGNPVALHLLDTLCAWIHAPASPPVGTFGRDVGTSGAF